MFDNDGDKRTTKKQNYSPNQNPLK